MGEISREPEESPRLVLHAAKWQVLDWDPSNLCSTQFLLGLGAGMLRLGVAWP